MLCSMSLVSTLVTAAGKGLLRIAWLCLNVSHAVFVTIVLLGFREYECFMRLYVDVSVVCCCSQLLFDVCINAVCHGDGISSFVAAHLRYQYNFVGRCHCFALCHLLLLLLVAAGQDLPSLP